jgi:hypothetical protein
MLIVNEEPKKLISDKFSPIPQSEWRKWFLAHPWFPMPKHLQDDEPAATSGNDAADQRQGESERSD